jgi:hypothetical protein
MGRCKDQLNADSRSEPSVTSSHNIHPLAYIRQNGQGAAGALQHPDASWIIAALDMIQRYRDLQDALVKIPYRSVISPPGIFEMLMRFEEFTLIKTLQATNRFGWQRLMARVEEISLRLVCRRRLHKKIIA